MEPLDVVVTVIFLSSTGGVLVFRTVRAWRRFRLQERTTALLIEGVRILEEARDPATAERNEKR